MKISCLLLSHNKPQTVHQAVKSVLDQIYQNWELLILDTGELLNALTNKDPRVFIECSPETEDMRKNLAIASWGYNYLLSKSRGDLITYLCDDDLFYPNAFHDFAMFLGNNPDIMACYGSEDHGVLFEDQRFFRTGERLALEICGNNCYGMDCRVDGMQLCHRYSALELIDKPYWSLDKQHAHHSDGLFMDKLSEKTLIYPILRKIGVNRRTPWSANIKVFSK